MTENVGQVLRHDDGDVWYLGLSNPRRRNAMTWTMYEQLQYWCETANRAPQLRALVLRGADGTFAAGTDIGQFAQFGTAEDGVAYERRIHEVLRSLLSVRVPVLGVVEGPAVGGGLAIAACCDVLVAAEDARFGIPIARTLGNIIAPAGMRRLRDRLGTGRTMAMLLTARLLDAAEAATAGFVHEVAAPDALEEMVTSVVSRLRQGAPLTLAGLKEIERRLEALDQLDPSEDVLARCYGSDDFREGVTAFLDGRTPEWTGH